MSSDCGRLALASALHGAPAMGVDHHTVLAAAIRSLAAEADPGCLLDCQGTFLFVNQAWEHYAEANGAAAGRLGSTLVGTAWIDHLAGEEIRRHHATLVDGALRCDPARKVVQVSEANTPALARLVATRFEPVKARGWGERLGIAVVHTTVRVRPIEEVYPLISGAEGQYRDADGHLVQCTCCRRVRAPASGRWDFVPSLVQVPPAGTRWAFCDLCLELHYPALQSEETQAA